jgi:hypothetical protein
VEQRKRARLTIGAVVLCLLIGALVFVACGPSSSDSATSRQSNAASVSLHTSSQNVTYNPDPKSVLIRTFRGGGLTGSLEMAPDLSVYGDGTFILGTQNQGQISASSLQQLLHTLTDTYGLPTMKRLSFSDTQDQNATFLELTLNGKTQEFMYGSFGTQQESTQDLAEYHQLDQALVAINEALTGPMHPYTSTQYAVLVRRIISPAQQLYWPVTDFTLGQAVSYECSYDDLHFADQESTNIETGCLQYTVPHNAIQLTDTQAQAVKAQLQGQLQGGFIDGSGYYFSVTLRPLLPDEPVSKALAMFGSAQESYMVVHLLTDGNVPPIPTPTPSR